ncbi:rhombosortase [Cellvibrio mixtus]|uniref:rhombosortase n=1 Tax=Cellvibrio mixtus TaxID=39650 RepID=UPI000B1BF3D4|nr:rhombosortase [Cellvibrio mixtus]
MKRSLSHPTFLASLAVSAVILVLAMFEPHLFNLFSLDPTPTRQGQYWRIFTANFVHFGWAHTLMNTAALILCTLALLSEMTLQKYVYLLLSSCLVVGLGIYWFNPEYQPYAGLSGAIHGLIVAGLIQTRAYPLWIKATGLLLIMGKLLQENLPGYEATDLQQLIPATVAVESHVYGAIAGAAFALGDGLIQLKKRKP